MLRIGGVLAAAALALPVYGVPSGSRPEREVTAPASIAPTAALSEAALCAGLRRVELAGTDQCTRGPETLPGVRLELPAAPLKAGIAKAAVAANPIVCEGDGRSGKRVQVMYVREKQQRSRLPLFLPSFRAWSHEIDAAYNDSAAQTGAGRHVRFVTEAVPGGCRIQVQEVVLPTDGLAGWEPMVTALQKLGHQDPNRKYLVFADAQKTCGVATVYVDDRPGLENANNRNTGYARVDASAGCWGFNAAAHELGHTFGAVQSSAPNYNGHCGDEWDLMCYGSGTTVVCPDKDSDRLLDCNKDDYFHPKPPAGSYLATHWNIANSDWLIKSPVPDARAAPRHGQVFELVHPASGGALGVLDASVADLAYLGRQQHTGATSQRWRFLYETGWQLQNVNSGKCADSAYSGTTPGTQVLQYRCNGQDGMRWVLHPVGGGRYGILNTLTGLAVTDAGSNQRATQQPFTAGPGQLWQLRAKNPR
ncbi:Ricin B lectin [Kribbella flavida DSM 17836]|uniref:Ricin B lectin n=1 Tax=Kribbella flavida (strain DSM 17836 / JCM 10339 / NBRC 14399) TaxID=479435 RepID=D2Q3F1_KRIFD|nr:RICIN domain-containing protein [Kribbella flavida]ADB34074.1 Ricin B lectin [Kribbella flavida DSM 17836]